MGHRFDARVTLDALDEFYRLVPGAAACAICHRDIAGVQRAQGIDGLEEPYESLVILRWKKLEGHRRRSGREHVADLHCRPLSGYHANPPFAEGAETTGAPLIQWADLEMERESHTMPVLWS